MPFAQNSCVTNAGAAIQAKRQVSSILQTAAIYIGVGAGAQSAGRTAAAADTALSSEVETRTAGTATTIMTAVANDTYQVQGAVTFTTSHNIDEAMLFDALTGGNCMLSATINPPVAVSNGDNLACIWLSQFHAGG